MKPRGTPLAAAALAAGILAPPLASAQDASAPETIEITVGATGESLIREVRSAQVVVGESSLRVFDVSPQLLPETIALRALASPELLEIRQQSAWFEILDLARAIQELGGRPTTLLRFHESGVERLDGRLLFPPVVPGPHGEVVLPLYLEQSDGKIRMLDGAEIELKAVPPGDWNRFRLDWRLTCKRTDRYRFELLYVTRGLSWRADYLLRVAADGASADFTALATVANDTGVAWRGARLALAEPGEAVAWSRRADPAERASALMHAVTDGAALDARATTQFPLAQARDLKVRAVATLLIDPSEPGARLPVVRRFDLVDAVARGVARALPAGTARVVLMDPRNRPFLASTQPFPSTIAGRTISFPADALPGVVAESTVRRGSDGAARVTVRIWSERDEKLDVEVLCPLEVATTVTDASFTAERTPQGLARFTVPTLPRSSATLEFNLARS